MKPTLLCLLLTGCAASPLQESAIHHFNEPTCRAFCEAVQRDIPGTSIYAGRVGWKQHCIICRQGLCTDNYIASPGMLYPLKQYSRRMENMRPVQLFDGVAVGVKENQLMVWR